VSVSQTAEYALRAVVRLAQQPGVAQTTQQLADATRVPQSYLPKVLQPLARAGIVIAQRGSHGGYSLHADPKVLSVMDVIACVDPVRRIDTCPGRDAIDGAALCALHQLLDADLAASEARFRETNIQQLLPASDSPLRDATVVAEVEPAN
jgi:Rrf2 family nitric oxide-sensitive transcriptional repressor